MSSACHIAITSCPDAYGCVFCRIREEKLQTCGMSVFRCVYSPVGCDLTRIFGKKNSWKNLCREKFRFMVNKLQRTY